MHNYMHNQSHYIEAAQGAIYVYGTEHDICAEFEPIGNTEKKIGRL